MYKMTLSELLKHCSFHESTIKDIEYNQQAKQVKVILNFCNCFQNEFTGKSADILLVHLIFYNVTSIEYEGFTLDVKRSAEILDENIEVNNTGKEGIHFLMEKSWTNSCYDIRIFADSLDFVVVEQPA